MTKTTSYRFAVAALAWAVTHSAACAEPAMECLDARPVPERPLPEALASLDGLPFDDFVHQSYLEILRRNPAEISRLGLGEAVGLRNAYLPDRSDAYAHRTYDLIEAILDRLRDYDPAALTHSQRIDRESYEWYLQDRANARAFLDYNVNDLVYAYDSLYYTLIYYHELNTSADAEDYVSRLRQIPRQIAQIREALAARASRGIPPHRSEIAAALEYLEPAANSQPRESAFFAPFVNDFFEGPYVEPDVLVHEDDVERAIECGALPALRALVDDLERLYADATPGNGLADYPGGPAAYARELRHHTTTDASAHELRQLGLDELDRIYREIRDRFAALGYPSTTPLADLFVRLAEDTGYLDPTSVVSEANAIIADAELRLDEAFAERADDELIVVASDGSYYIDPDRDGGWPAEFHIDVTFDVPRFTLRTLTYHEAVPGHHLQLSLAQQLGLPLFREEGRFTASTEGWALYAERLTAELGWYEDDPVGELGRLQDEALRAARLVVDTGLHDLGWTQQRAIEFLVERVGLPVPVARGQVERYSGWPGQATAYWVGMQRLLEERQRARDRLGARFDLIGFHSAVLGAGPAPLAALGHVIDGYITAEEPRRRNVYVSRTPTIRRAAPRRAEARQRRIP